MTETPEPVRPLSGADYVVLMNMTALLHDYVTSGNMTGGDAQRTLDKLIERVESVYAEADDNEAKSIRQRLSSLAVPLSELGGRARKQEHEKAAWTQKNSGVAPADRGDIENVLNAMEALADETSDMPERSAMIERAHKVFGEAEARAKVAEFAANLRESLTHAPKGDEVFLSHDDIDILLSLAIGFQSDLLTGEAPPVLVDRVRNASVWNGKPDTESMVYLTFQHLIQRLHEAWALSEPTSES